jgi:radical SAM protein with 4Fe4S-binding SPASM domain
MGKVKQQIEDRLPSVILNVYRFMINSNFRKKMLFRKFGIRYAPRLTDFPNMVMIDTTTRCNLSCNHCPSNILSKDRNWVGDMDFKLYKKIIDEIAVENPNTIVRPFDGGEPLVRKDMEQLIKYAKNQGIKYVSINTNGTLLNQNRARSILDSGLDHIEISIDAFSEETYKAMKNVNLYNKVVANVERLIRLKDRIRPGFKISVSFVKQKNNYHECDDFYSYWSKKVNHVTVREYHQHGGLVSGYGQYKKFDNKFRHPCPYLWNRIIVQHNGEVRFCENDWKAEHIVGNVKNQSLKDIWNSEGYLKLRQSHIQGSFDHPFCRKCTDWKVIGSNG